MRVLALMVGAAEPAHCRLREHFNKIGHGAGA